MEIVKLLETNRLVNAEINLLVQCVRCHHHLDQLFVIPMLVLVMVLVLNLVMGHCRVSVMVVGRLCIVLRLLVQITLVVVLMVIVMFQVLVMVVDVKMVILVSFVHFHQKTTILVPMKIATIVGRVQSSTMQQSVLVKMVILETSVRHHQLTTLVSVIQMLVLDMGNVQSLIKQRNLTNVNVTKHGLDYTVLVLHVMDTLNVVKMVNVQSTTINVIVIVSMGTQVQNVKSNQKILIFVMKMLVPCMEFVLSSIKP